MAELGGRTEEISMYQNWSLLTVSLFLVHSCSKTMIHYTTSKVFLKITHNIKNIHWKHEMWHLDKYKFLLFVAGRMEENIVFVSVNLYFLEVCTSTPHASYHQGTSGLGRLIHGNKYLPSLYYLSHLWDKWDICLMSHFCEGVSWLILPSPNFPTLDIFSML